MVCKKNGFTLVELMVAVAIIAIISAIALPSYTAYVRSSSEAQAKEKVLLFANEADRWRLKFKNYAGFDSEFYTVDASGDYFIPSNNSGDYRYQVRILDASGNALHSATRANGWVMYAMPNTSRGTLKYADAVILSSSSSGCYIDRGNGNPASISALTSLDCNDAKAKAW